MNHPMETKKALVTGGERGTGRGIVTRLAQEGYDIALTYFFDTEEDLSIEKEITQMGRRCFLYKVDFRNTEEVERVVGRAVSDLGGLDLLVNNSGIKEPMKYLYEITADEIDTIFAVNYRAYMLLMRDALRHMMKAGTKGNIVNISSLSAERSFPRFSQYGGLKAAICRGTQDVALEAAPYGIRVNSILPGAVNIRTREQLLRDGKTDEYIRDRLSLGNLIPLQRMVEPIEIGNAVVWLASEQAAYITGVNLCVDGGHSLPGIPERKPLEGETDFGWARMKIMKEEEMKDW